MTGRERTSIGRSPMPTLDCQHVADGQVHHVCRHLLDMKDPEYLRCFTGQGMEYRLLCPGCAGSPESTAEDLRTVCPSCFAAIQREGSWLGIEGRPAVRERS